MTRPRQETVNQDNNSAQLLLVLIPIRDAIEVEVREARLYLFVQSPPAGYQDDKLAKKSDMNSASNSETERQFLVADITEQIRFLSACSYTVNTRQTLRQQISRQN